MLCISLGKRIPRPAQRSGAAGAFNLTIFGLYESTANNLPMVPAVENSAW
jgi:hypothetical protein